MAPWPRRRRPTTAGRRRGTLAGADPDGDAITYHVVAAPAHGTLTGTAPNADYTPSGTFVGTDTFTFTVGDGRLTSAPATATITVTASAVTRLLISDDTNRSVNVRQLDGQTLRNGAPMYVFVGPAAVVPTIKQVRFYLDDPQRDGTPFALETVDQLGLRPHGGERERVHDVRRLAGAPVRVEPPARRGALDHRRGRVQGRPPADGAAGHVHRRRHHDARHRGEHQGRPQRGRRARRGAGCPEPLHLPRRCRRT